MPRPAVDDVSLAMHAGECVGLIGASGSGKSTFASIVANLTPPDSGGVELCGREITQLKGRARRQAYRDLQMVFQNFGDAFNPHFTLGASVAEFGRNFGQSKAEAQRSACEAFERVGLPAYLLERMPSEVSGGQCQRAAIARALMVRPKLLICDEVTSALDVSVQASVVEVLRSLKGSMGILFITHDLALLDSLCDRAVVMHDGRIVEEGPAREVTAHPKDAYTKRLISSVFTVAGPTRTSR